MENNKAVEAYPVDGGVYMNQQQPYGAQTQQPYGAQPQQPYSQGGYQASATSQPYHGPTAQQAVSVASAPFAPQGVAGTHPGGPHHVVVVQTRNEGAVMRKPHSYCCLAWLSLFCCCPIGLFAVYNAYKVNRYFDRQEFEKAYKASEMAKKAAILAVIVGIIVSIAGGVEGSENTAHQEDGSFSDNRGN